MIFIALIVCASLFICLKPAMNVGETIDDAINGETIIETKPEETSATEVTIDNTIAFEYKMAEIKPKESTETETKFFYVVEFLHNEHSAATFIPISCDNKELVEKYPNSKVDVYNGHICNEDFITHTEENISFSNYRELITIVITIEDKVEENEVFAIKTSVMHRENGTTEDVKLKINDTIQNVTTVQNIIYGKTLVNIDGDYYVFQRIGTGESEKPLSVFTSYSLTPIGAETNSINEKFNKNVSFVTAKNEKISLPEGYKIYFVTNERGYDIGIECTIPQESVANDTSNKETEANTNVDENLMKTEIFLTFKDKDGNEINFVSNIKKSD